MSEQDTLRILMVCLGNICRSPTAQAVMEQRVKEAGLADRIEVDSAGTGDYHIGKPPDTRALHAARQRGYDLSPLRARQLERGDYHRFDHLFAMDHTNLRHMRELAPEGTAGRVQLLLSPLDENAEVPDPYFGGEEGFGHVLDLVEEACDHWLAHFRAQLSERAGRD